MHLIDKFLVTGADSIEPRPHVSHASLEKAISAAKTMVSNAAFKQTGAIIWVPFRVVKPKEIPVEVLDAADCGAPSAVRSQLEEQAQAMQRDLTPGERNAVSTFREAAAQYNKAPGKYAAGVPAPKEALADNLETIASEPPITL